MTLGGDGASVTAGALDAGGGSVMTQQRVTSEREKNLGRNDPCWCGSGKKFKRCHGAYAGLAPLKRRVDVDDHAFMRRLFDLDGPHRSPARTVVTCTCLTAATTFVLWRVLFHQPLWLVGIVAGSCSLLVALAATHSLRHPEATVNRAVRRTPWFEATLLLGSVGDRSDRRPARRVRTGRGGAGVRAPGAHPPSGEKTPPPPPDPLRRAGPQRQLVLQSNNLTRPFLAVARTSASSSRGVGIRPSASESSTPGSPRCRFCARRAALTIRSTLA